MSKMKTILIDLDGTLLHMDLELFAKYYFGTIIKKFNEEFKVDNFKDALFKSTGAMIENDGSMSNEDKFWNVFESLSGFTKEETFDFFDEFYKLDFDITKNATSKTPYAKELIDNLLEKGHDIIVATNPMFPSIATHKRVKWAGLDPKVFKEITTYENYSYCKPNTMYYQEILDKFNLKAEECIMIGNDMDEDFIAKNLGIDICIVTDNLINRNNKEIEDVLFKGTLKELVDFTKNKA
ncbi:MAG: HAD family hydrolase [Erysipelotrichaceae bacterium]|nr:HAD family hydrolase [Erysipelotrichaceae bacterium]